MSSSAADVNSDARVDVEPEVTKCAFPFRTLGTSDARFDRQRRHNGLPGSQIRT